MVCAKDYIYYPDIVLILAATRSALVPLALSGFFLTKLDFVAFNQFSLYEFLSNENLINAWEKKIILKVFFRIFSI